MIPMQCEYFALEGLSQLMMTIRKTKELYNPDLEIAGILITMYNGRLNLSTQVLKELKKYYADKILSEPIPRSVRISEAPSHGLPICYYDKSSKGAKAYEKVAKQLTLRIRRKVRRKSREECPFDRECKTRPNRADHPQKTDYIKETREKREDLWQ